MNRLKALWNRFLNDETGSICVGCGLDVNGGSGLLEVQLDPAGGITCGPSGLAATAVSFPGISPNDCNAITNPGNGLYVACQDGVAASSAVQVSPQGSGLPQTTADSGSYGYLNDNSTSSIHICNPTCCTVSGIVFVAVGDIYVDAHPGFIGGGKLQANINAGGFGDIEPLTRQTITADSGNAQHMFFDFNQNASLFLSLAPTACVDYQFNFLVSVNTAAGSILRTDSTGPKFVTRWVLTHTDCCDHHN